ncbi:putative mediator of RNA polymerase II transcription subunit 26 [Belonocnema kinseyi]|uniref:putative mediator of RNA polymerase II transcription subunit 26 n=1 Tax=Belonocnema kinseyi TaxID=2817044 RepID=UPI00143D411D|nr:putative mediator of RNA polymerase II transcription subunit 26 [Belonocnema kinseyi]
MTEGGAGGAVKPKRNGARVFKNPPQPHMCIQDYMQGSDLPCYVNVLSWDKVAMPCSLAQTIPLYGGMRVSPPRGEKPEVGVFAVIANPELLKKYGKNSQDKKERTTLIDLLLNFIEAKNEGVYFSRKYTVLKDRDITGELKEVWMAVQAKRERENLAPQQETWIDAQPAPAPNYPQYSDQQQHQLQQQQQQVDYAQPPQYRSNAAYSMGSVSTNEVVNHEREIRFNYSEQNPTVTQSEQAYQSRSAIAHSYNSNGNMISADSRELVYRDRPYRERDWRERGRPNVPQNQTQQNCPAYPAPQYQFQQLPRQMVPQYVNSNVNPNYISRDYRNSPVLCRQEGDENMTKLNLNYYSDSQKPMTAAERRQVDNAMKAEAIRIQQHQMQQIQQQQIQHQQPINQQGNHQQYQSHQAHQRQQQQLQHEAEENSFKGLQRSRHRPHMGVAQKSNSNKRQIEAPAHSDQASCWIWQPKELAESIMKPKSPVKVLQRDSGSQEKQGATLSGESSESTPEKSETRENIGVSRIPQSIHWDEKVSGRRNGRRINAEFRKRQIVWYENGMKEEQQNSEPERLSKHEKNAEDELIQTMTEIETQLHLTVSKLGRNDFTNKAKTESPKRTQSTVNSIIKNVFKQSSSSQGKSNARANSNEQDETYHQAYTILKKPEVSTTSGESTVPVSRGPEEEISEKLAQISIEDCKDATEVNAVLS